MTEVKANPRESRIDGLGALLETCGSNWFQCWVWPTLAGFALVLFAIMLGIGGISFDGRLADGAVVNLKIPAKEVGYMAAINWSLYGVLIVPLMVAFALKIWAAMPTLLADLSDAGMIRDDEFRRVDSKVLIQQWNRKRRQLNLMFALIFLCVFIFAMRDWWTTVGHAILRPKIMDLRDLSDKELEFDWSISCLYKNTHVACGPLFGFGLIAYVLIPGLSSAIAFATAICSLAFVNFICGGERNTPRWRLTAAPGEDDSRGGFGRFSSFFGALLVMCLGVVVGCIFMIMQNTYLRDSMQKDIFTMIFGEADWWSRLVQHSIADMFEVSTLQHLFEPAMIYINNPDSGIGVFLFASVAIATVVISWIVLRTSAMRARDTALHHLPKLSAEHRMSQSDAQDELEAMNFWPIGWMGLNQLFFLMFGLVLSLVSFRLLLLPMAFVALVGGHKFLEWTLETVRETFSERGQPAVRRSRPHGRPRPPTSHGVRAGKKTPKSRRRKGAD